MNSPLAIATATAFIMMVATAQAFAVMPPRSIIPSPRTTTPTSSLSFSMTPFDEVLSDSSLIQDEFYNGMEHALLDLTSLWGANAGTRARLASVLGRLFVIGQDVQHEVLPDELAFQLGLLAVACHGLANTVMPKLRAKFLTPNLLTSKDRVAYRSLFRPAGLSWEDFKQLHSGDDSGIMEWVQVEPGHVLLNEHQKENEDNAVYWVYEGEVQVWSHDTLSHNITGRQQVAGLGLLGEGRLANLLDSSKSSPSSTLVGDITATLSASSTPTTTGTAAGLKAVAAGEDGATVLKICPSKLEKFLRRSGDQEMSLAIQRLAFMGMQDKLNALLQQKEGTPAAASTTASTP